MQVRVVKFEPKELERLRLPCLEDIHGYLAEEKGIAQTVVTLGAASGRSHSDTGLSERAP